MYLLQGNKHLLTLNLLMEEVIYKKNKQNLNLISFQVICIITHVYVQFITHVHFWYISL